MRRAATFLGLVAATGIVVVTVHYGRRASNETRAPGRPALVVADGGSPLVATPGGDRTWIACGDARCSLPGEACCVYSFPPDREPAPAFYQCIDGAICPRYPIGPRGGSAPPSALRCASPANCARGDVCCIAVAKVTVSSSCVEPEECQVELAEGERERERGVSQATGSGGLRARLCRPGVEGECPNGVACAPRGAVQWQLPPGYGTCGVADEGPY